jgi:hypothetical protein
MLKQAEIKIMDLDTSKIQTKILKIQSVKDLRDALSDYSGDYSISFSNGDIDDVLSEKEQEDYDLEHETREHVIRIVNYEKAIGYKSLTIELFTD